MNELLKSGDGLRSLFSRRDCTYLGVGPMSKNCVDAVIELSNDFDVPIILIASRRQIESMELGGGYVNNWDTLKFAQYVRAHDKKGKVILARDHGGPWQHPQESLRFTNIDEAMESAKISYLRDLEAGFQILHIDPVINLDDQEPTLDWVLDKVFELYEFCMDVAKTLKRPLLIELGTEEQRQNPLSDLNSLRNLLDQLKDFCKTKGFPPPDFIVVQTGTKVMGTRNIGDFPSHEDEIESYTQRHKLAEVIDICESHGVMLKEHNTDYLSEASLKFHPRIGIHAANVAPEFGTCETKAIISLMDSAGRRDLKDRFINLAVSSKKWTKWVAKDESPTDLEKALIAGHYVFATEEFLNIKSELAESLKKKSIVLDEYLKLAVKKSIGRYLTSFGMIPSGTEFA